MSDRIFWKYLEELPEQEAAWREWHHHLASWNRFDAFSIHYLKIGFSRVTRLKCTVPCDHDCPRQVVEHSPNNIAAVCPQKKAASVQLEFKDILIYSLRREAFHRALCAALQIKYSGYRWPEYGNAWYLGVYHDVASKLYCPVYMTNQKATLLEAISSLYRLHQKSFILMTPTGRGITPEAQQFLEKNNSVLLSMADELTLQPDGSFKPVRGIGECMQSRSDGCLQAGPCKNLPIEAYKYIVYSES